MQSLLGQFYSKIKGSQEDLASESLTYILKKSDNARKVINQIVKIETGLVFSDLSYSTQNIGKKLERPDISGKNNEGKEVLLIEAKFWASLTDNQPNGYLERLKNDTILIFLVPTLRVKPVFEEVLIRIKEKYSDIEIETENNRVKINTANKHILIKNWNEILNGIKSKLVQENQQNLISDIDQIIGLVDTIDSNSFQPIRSEDLSPSIPKRIKSYYDIVDKVVNNLISRNEKINNHKLMKGNLKNGYKKYFRFENFGFGMSYFPELWEKYADTPFWLSIAEEKPSWEVSEQLNKKCEKLAFNINVKYVKRNKEIYLSLKPKLYETEDIVIKDLTEQIEKIIEKLGN